MMATEIVSLQAILELIEEHNDCDKGEGLEAGCTLLQDLRDLVTSSTIKKPDPPAGKTVSTQDYLDFICVHREDIETLGFQAHYLICSNPPVCSSVQPKELLRA